MITTNMLRFGHVALPVLFLLVNSNVYCQLLPDSQEYEFAEFRFPDIDRRALDVQFNLAGSADKFIDFANNNRGDTTKRSSNFQTLSLDLSRYKISEKKQLQQSLHVYGSNQVIKNDLSSTLKSATHVLSFFSSQQERTYFKPKRFWGYTSGMVGSYFKDVDDLANSPMSVEQKIIDFEANILLQYGEGRIDPIDDVFLAKFMMDDLIEKGVLLNALNEDDLFSLARVMAAARNQRVFDLRRRRIYEITRLDDWFKERGLIGKDEAAYFTTMIDNWLYGFLNARSVGKRITVGIGPVFDYSEFYFSNFNITSIGTYSGATARVEYTRHSPLNELMQEEFNFSCGLEYLSNLRLESAVISTELLRPFINTSIQYGFFPNSRTQAYGNLGLRYEYYEGFKERSPLDFHVFIPTAGINVNYFINYRMRLNGSLAISGLWSSNSQFSRVVRPIFPDSNDSNQLDISLASSLKLTYSIF